MKAILVHEFGGPEVLKLEEIPTPRPAAGQVLVRVKAVGVNPYDTYMRNGTYAIKPPLPYTPGSDAAGTIESVGAGVSKVKPGDRVYTANTLSGTYAEYTLAVESQVHSLPDRASFAQGAGLWVPYGTAYHALRHLADARAGETVLIHGASGGVGIAAVQIARARGDAAPTVPGSRFWHHGDVSTLGSRPGVRIRRRSSAGSRPWPGGRGRPTGYGAAWSSARASDPRRRIPAGGSRSTAVRVVRHPTHELRVGRPERGDGRPDDLRRHGRGAWVVEGLLLGAALRGHRGGAADAPGAKPGACRMAAGGPPGRWAGGRGRRDDTRRVSRVGGGSERCRTGGSA